MYLFLPSDIVAVLASTSGIKATRVIKLRVFCIVHENSTSCSHLIRHARIYWLCSVE